jgi:Peptidase family M28/PA domain
MRRGRISGVVMAVGLVAAGAGARAAPGPTAAEVSADVRFLSAPGLEGRGALTAGLDQAARFIAGRFAALGLQPAGERGTFFQAVDIPLPQRPSAGTRLEIGSEGLVLGRDFQPNSGTAATRAAGPLVFVGYGLVVPGRRDDLGGVDLRGKVALCLRPPLGQRRFALPDGQALFGSVLTAEVLKTAVARGAVGVLFVDAEPASGGSGGAGPTGDDSRAVEPLPAYTIDDVSSIASFHVRAAAVDRWLAPSHTTVAELAAASRADARPWPSLSTWVSFAVVWEPPFVSGRNVIGLLPGRDPASAGEAVLVGAHYDHLGRGNEGGALDGAGIHPGADDNASGTAALLAVAGALARTEPRPRRSILFVAFTGEEKGWAGSRVVADRPPKRVVAMLNLDMVGRMQGNGLEVNGTASSPQWRAIVEAANAGGDRLALSYPRGVPGGSDHQPFILKNVPALFFFTGMHCDYHRGGDTWDKINAEGVLQVARLTSSVARQVADRAQGLAFEMPAWSERRPPLGCPL